MSINTYNETNNKISFTSVVLGIYVVAIGFGFPLVVKDRYFDILVFKYYYYLFFTISMFIIILGYYLTGGIKYTILAIKEFNIRSFIHKLTLIDIFILLYWFIALVSTFSSDYFYEAFWGNEGRFTGFFLITWYVMSYFCISRLWKYKSWYIDLILIAGVLVCLFGITDYFNLDILKFKALMLPEQRPIFTSTLGNINTYTAYVGIITAMSTVLFATEKKTTKMYFYCVCMIISFFSIIMGVSDNAYLSLAALLGLLPIYLFKNKSGVKRYIIILAIFFTVTQCIDWINVYFKNQVLGIDSAFNIVISYNKLHYLVILLWIIVLLLYLYDIKKKNGLKSYGNKLIYIWISFITVVLIGIVYALYDCNISGNADRYSFASNYLLLNDDWGTHRGFIWRNAIECYKELPFWKKMVGYGPETFGILMMKKTANNPYKEIFDSAHNEYLHTLLTVGLLGVTAYVISLLTFIKCCISDKKNSIYIKAVVFGVICYSTQAFVNLNLPIVTPMLWLLLGIGSASLSKE
ncbi:MAG: O-antigen ligase family protein [Paenibacillaceae bacterium]|jgi:hypothetical protein|nr:O-antigen ligase family protein [Paenibacillaceae bacterium]